MAKSTKKPSVSKGKSSEATGRITIIKLRKGEIRQVDLPFDNAKIERFIRDAEKDPDKIDALKNPEDVFSFTVEGNRIPTTFRSIKELNNTLNYYLKTGSKGARVSIFRVTGPNDWTQIKSKSAIKRKRLRAHLKKTDKVAYTELVGKERTRKRRYLERLKASGEINDYRKKDKARKRKWRAKHSAEIKKTRKETNLSKRATKAQKRAAIRARKDTRRRSVSALRQKYFKL